MLETGNEITIQPRITLRIGNHSLAFAVADKTAVKGVAYETYTVKSGFSIAANLREAFRQSALLSREEYKRAQVMLAAPSMLVPIEEFDEDKNDALYRYTFVTQPNTTVIHCVLPQQNAVAIMGINKDLKMVIDDHYADVIYMPVEQPVWSYMHHRSPLSLHRQLYAYFHDESVGIFAFSKNHFTFCNTYNAKHIQDSIYYILYVWKLLQLDAEKDELFIACTPDQEDELLKQLRRYLTKAYAVNASAEFNRAPITEIKGIPLDMITLYTRGR